MLHGNVGPDEGVDKGGAGEVIEDCYADELGLAVESCAHLAVYGDGDGSEVGGGWSGLDLEAGSKSWGERRGEAVGAS